MGSKVYGFPFEFEVKLNLEEKFNDISPHFFTHTSILFQLSNIYHGFNASSFYIVYYLVFIQNNRVILWADICKRMNSFSDIICLVFIFFVGWVWRNIFLDWESFLLLFGGFIIDFFGFLECWVTIVPVMILNLH